MHLEDLRLDSRRWIRISAPSLHACAMSKQVQFPPQVSPDLPSGSWPLPGQSDGSTAMVSRDPGSSEEGRNTRRRLDIGKGPDDENGRSAVLLLFFVNNAFPACTHGLKRHSLQPISRKESTAKEERNQLESCSIQEPNVKTLWQGSRMMACHDRSTVFSVALRVQLLFVNPDHQNCERSVDVLHRSGKLWLPSCKKISLKMTPKVHTLFQPLISVPKYSTCLIAGMEWSARFQACPSWTRTVVWHHFSWCVRAWHA